MIAESIKSVLGEDLSAQVEQALKGKGRDGKDLDLVVGNDGSFVPVEKYNGAVSGRTSADAALKAAAETLKAIGGSGDPAKLGEDVRAAQEKMAQLQENYTTELGKIRTDAALHAAFAGKVHDPSDVIALLDRSKIEVGDDGVLKTDPEVLLKPIRDAKPYLFKEQQTQAAVGGLVPANSGHGAAQGAQGAQADGPVVM